MGCGRSVVLRDPKSGKTFSPILGRVFNVTTKALGAPVAALAAREVYTAVC